MAQPSFYPSPQPAPDPTAAALTCPRCSAPGRPGPIAQSCGRCGRRFTLSAGAALDGSVVPPPAHPGAFRIFVKWSIVVSYRVARLDPMAVYFATLDPVVGMAPLDETGIAYGDIVSIAVWRNLALSEIIVGTLIPLPIALFAAYGAILAVTKSAGVGVTLGVIALGFGLIAAWMLYRGIVIGRRHARVTGRWRSFTVRFEKSPAFYEELFRRSGIVAPVIP